MKITFGKFEGWDTEDLAKAGETGRSYLSWGAGSLRSPMWAKEFERVLNLPVEYDEGLMVDALVASDPDIDYYDAQIYVREQLAQIVEDNAINDRMESTGEALIAEYAPKLGVDANKLRGLAHKWQWSWEGNIYPSNFSSRKNYDLFVEFMTKWDDR